MSENTTKINITVDTEDAIEKINRLKSSIKGLTFYQMVVRGNWIKLLSLAIQIAILAVLIWK